MIMLWKGTLFLDADDSYSNHYQCVQYPRLTYVGPAGKAKRKSGAKHERKYFVDGVECPDIDAVLTMLNTEPRADRTPE